MCTSAVVFFQGCLTLLIFSFFLHVPSDTTHTSKAFFSIHARMLSSTLIRPFSPLRRAVNGTAYTVDVIYRFFGTTITTVALKESPQRCIFAPNLPTPVNCPFSRVQAHRDRPTTCPLWRRSGSAVECRTLDRENTVTNPLHIGAVDGDSLWRCYATTKQNHCTCALQ